MQGARGGMNELKIPFSVELTRERVDQIKLHKRYKNDGNVRLYLQAIIDKMLPIMLGGKKNG